MVPLIIGSVCVAGYMWLINAASPTSPRQWRDEGEHEKFIQEREKWSKTAAFWYLLR